MRAPAVGLGFAIALLAPSAAAQIHVACVGDSITRGDGTSAPNNAYPAVLQTLLGATHAVENDGHSGATMLKSGDVPYWNTTEYQSSTSWAAAGGDVVIQLGTNDSKPKNWTGKASFVSDCEALVDHYRAGSPSTRVWINLVPPATASACCKISGTTIATEIVPMLAQCAAAKGATTIDVYSALAPHTDWLTDGVHPNDAGAALIAQTVHAAISKLPAIALAASAPQTPAPAAFTLTATPAAAYGKTEKVRFYEGNVLLQELVAAPWTYDLSGVAAGSHSYTAEIVETAGRSRTSSVVVVDVAPAPPPVLDASVDDAAVDAAVDAGVGSSTSSASGGSSTSSSSSSGDSSSSSASSGGEGPRDPNGTAAPAGDAKTPADAGATGCSAGGTRGRSAIFAAGLGLGILLATRRRRSS